MRLVMRSFVVFMLLTGVATPQSKKTAGTKTDSKQPTQAVQPAGATVTGSGTQGHLSKWGVGGTVLVDTGITEDKFSNVTVAGSLKANGGVIFPDGSSQTTGFSVPLSLSGDTSGAILDVTQSNFTGVGLRAMGGRIALEADGSSSPAGGGIAIQANGGSADTQSGASGVVALGGRTSSGPSAGAGLVAQGGTSLGTGSGGDGVIALGTGSTNGPSGVGLRAEGGGGVGSTLTGPGVVALGGSNTGTTFKLGAAGVSATGGFSTSGVAGDGITATGGDSFSGFAGVGVRAFGGIRDNGTNTNGGIGMVASGGAADFAGAGIQSIGGPASGAGHVAGDGIRVFGGQGRLGATPGRAGVFQGDVEISGALNVSGTKNFKIDHPLDPENKYLIHAAIESSEVLNVYSGNVRTNAKGEATVTLPDWFEALNRDFRYQLTVVGTFAQAIVAEKVKQNRFRIRTSTPNTEVSWQVTGVRSDAVMLKHPFKAEEEKPERERGHYLSPEAYDQPQERSVESSRNPEAMRRAKSGPRSNAGKYSQQPITMTIEPR